MDHSIFIYVLIAALVSLLIRALPTTLLRRQITSRFVRSFLYYVPYVTLSVMTFPAIMEATNNPIAGGIALIVGIAAAWMGLSLFPVSVICCVVVFLLELIS